jgi:hypothetical protein
VRDARDVTTVLQLVLANTPWAGKNFAAGSSDPLAVAASGSPHVINRLQIARAAQHQVALKVAVVELSRSAAWSLYGKAVAAQGASAAPDANHTARAIVPILCEVSDRSVSEAWVAAAHSGVKPASWMDGRPTLESRQIMLYDQPATVVATGQCLVPTSPASANQRGIAFGIHGVELKFTPVSADGDSLRINVAASAGRPGGRQFNGTVALREGRALALAGLLPPSGSERDLQQTTIRWPLLNPFGAMESLATQERETVILILPEAVLAH